MGVLRPWRWRWRVTSGKSEGDGFHRSACLELLGYPPRIAKLLHPTCWGSLELLAASCLASVRSTKACTLEPAFFRPFPWAPVYIRFSLKAPCGAHNAPPPPVRPAPNIRAAQASITVEGTEFVIDCARAKELSYDPYLKAGGRRTEEDGAGTGSFTSEAKESWGFEHVYGSGRHSKQHHFQAKPMRNKQLAGQR